MPHYLAEYGLQPVLGDSFAAFLAATDRVMLWLRRSRTASPGWTTIAFVTETELYAGAVRRTAREAAKRSNVEGMLRDLSELKLGDPVVHEQHGIARYQGLVNLDLGEGENEFLLLEYAGDDKLYVPVAQLHVISRYSGGAPETAPLHKLGSGAVGQGQAPRDAAGARHRRRTAEPLRAARAAQGPRVQAEAARLRGVRRRLRFRGNARPGRRDRGGDQRPAIRQADGPADLRRCRLRQDRGRAARRVRRGRWTASRSRCWCRPRCSPSSISRISPTASPTCRSRSPSCRASAPPRKQTQALKDMADGKLDIVIGTHKLIQKDVKFHNLGLVIIDEEHRFGVQQKERLKALRAEVDVLTLTATPIPRTLAMSLEGLRDFSVIATAPQRRLVDQDLRRAGRQRHHPRGGAARTEARRAGLFPAQRGRHHRQRARRSWRRCCRRRASASRTARWTSATWSR